MWEVKNYTVYVFSWNTSALVSGLRRLVSNFCKTILKAFHSVVFARNHAMSLFVNIFFCSIQPMIQRRDFDHCCLSCQFLIPERELCVDETLVPTKGHNVMRQYIPSKVAKFGIMWISNGIYLANVCLQRSTFWPCSGWNIARNSSSGRSAYVVKSFEQRISYLLWQLFLLHKFGITPSPESNIHYRYIHKCSVFSKRYLL